MSYSPEYIVGVMQDYRKRPKSYKHYVSIPRPLYIEVCNAGIIDVDDMVIQGSAFFEYIDDWVRISSQTYWNIEDIHIRILDYLVKKVYGNCPVVRGLNMF